MKQLLIFLFIVTICGSLTKPPTSQPCNTDVQMKFYYRGKYVTTIRSSKIWYNSAGGNDWTDGGRKFIADSIVISMADRSTRTRIVFGRQQFNTSNNIK